jgi:hypothetical protein
MGSTTVTTVTGDARMTAVIASGSFVAPVTFAVTRLEPLTLLPEIGLTSAGTETMLDPIVAYEIAFEVPVLNRDATLTFDVYLAGLDAVTREAVLAALAIGEATIATRSEAGSPFRTFAICAAPEGPSIGGCVQIAMLDANGQATENAPAIARFSNVVGHFSTWAVVVSSAADTTPPILVVPGHLSVDAINPAGAPVTYLATASDSVDPTPQVGCQPASGSVFPIGTTSVSCTATDQSGNAVTQTFNVRVRSAVEQIISLAWDRRCRWRLPDR